MIRYMTGVVNNCCCLVFPLFTTCCLSSWKNVRPDWLKVLIVICRLAIWHHTVMEGLDVLHCSEWINHSVEEYGLEARWNGMTTWTKRQAHLFLSLFIFHHLDFFIVTTVRVHVNNTTVTYTVTYTVLFSQRIVHLVIPLFCMASEYTWNQNILSSQNVENYHCFSVKKTTHCMNLVKSWKWNVWWKFLLNVKKWEMGK